MKMITISLNEQYRQMPVGATAGELRDQFKPDHDIIIINGFHAHPEMALKDSDQVVLIRRGVHPSAAEMESLLVARHTPGVHERIKAATVGIAGLGGLGTNVAISLARMGIGTLILADYDVVEPSNLNRQQYNIEHIGMYKTAAMVDILQHINPYANVRTYCGVIVRQSVCRLFNGADVIVECFDNADAKMMLIQAVSDLLPDTYLIGASGIAGYGKNNTLRTERLSTRLYMVGDFAKRAEPGQGLMAPRVGIAANLQANLTISLLMGKTDC